MHLKEALIRKTAEGPDYDAVLQKARAAAKLAGENASKAGIDPKIAKTMAWMAVTKQSGVNLGELRSYARNQVATAASAKPGKDWKYMDPEALEQQKLQQKFLQDKNIPFERKLSILDDIEQRNVEAQRRAKYKINDQQLNEVYQLKAKAKEASFAALNRAAREGKSEYEQKQIAAAAGKAVIEPYLREKGMSGAEALKNFGQYYQNLPAGQQMPSYVDPTLVEDIKKAKGGKAYSWGINIPYVRHYVQNKADKAVKAGEQEFSQGFTQGVQTAPEEYRKARNAAVGDFFKNNWGKLAGLGVGLAGVMALWRMGNRMGGQQGGQQQAQQQQPMDWTSNKNYGYGAHQQAGSLAQTTGMKPPMAAVANPFVKFMQGRA